MYHAGESTVDRLNIHICMNPKYWCIYTQDTGTSTSWSIRRHLRNPLQLSTRFPQNPMDNDSRDDDDDHGKLNDGLQVVSLPNTHHYLPCNAQDHGLHNECSRHPQIARHR